MAKNVLRVTNLTYGILTKVTFDLSQGEKVALMGPNGAGKSTLARLLAGLIEPVSGEIELFKHGYLIPWSKIKRWQEIGLIGQHPRRQTIGATVGEELGFGLLNLGYDVQTVRQMVLELAAKIGLAERLNQSPATLSGGERQRLVVAAILAVKPSFLILDEALTMLDVRAQERILELLRTYGGDAGQLWITHDPDLAYQADRLWVMKDGKLKDLGDPKRVLSNLKICDEYSIRYKSNLTEPYWAKNFLVEGSLVKGPAAKHFSKVPKHQASMGFYDQAIAKNAKDQESLNNDYFWNEKRRQSQAGDSKIEERKQAMAALEWRDANYPSRLVITQRVLTNEFIGVLGPSGAGKSTLLESVIGIIQPAEGKCLAFGEKLGASNLNKLRQRIRLVLQEAGEYLLGRTVYQEVFYLQTRKERERKREANLAYLRTFGIAEELADKPPEILSGGERQKVALAAALQSQPEVLLLDEPLLGLDAQARILMHQIIGNLKGKLTVLYVTHDLAEVAGLAERLWLIEEGRLALDCPADDWPSYVNRLKEAGVRCP